MAIRKTGLTTELKDLDVDRVDGVDRPATGRAFALFKSEISDDMAQIMALVTKADPYAQIIAAACDAHIVKMLDSRDVLKGFCVKGTDTTSPMFPTLAAAVAFVTKVVHAEIAKGRKLADPKDMDETMIAPGATAPMAEDENPELRAQMKPKKSGIWQRHMESKGGGVRLDNRVYASSRKR